ncbi:hydroxyisourate hydrolase [Catenovulum sp. 2E275]|uniref:hydroxyisourate hydrolase n=1 Tax=Catenovulum sp. 2E275 TaxID=2980497 RepID=UPI0021CE417D|nr:hydroxyisourate hydrolase [Catenovulum sp. 2E275]MCU4676031.1 hydroxyisourate hydrolase [Catenovulum sp. 2E275]
MNKSPITTHVLDTALGKPAAGINIELYQQTQTGWQLLASGETDADGRITNWLNPQTKLEFATYKLIFKLEAYWQQQQQTVFYPSAEICFNLSEQAHYHIPLLLSPYGYSTYRGS